MRQSFDQQRRKSPKLTITTSQENLDFVDEFIKKNPNYGNRSKAINKMIEMVRKAN